MVFLFCFHSVLCACHGCCVEIRDTMIIQMRAYKIRPINILFWKEAKEEVLLPSLKIPGVHCVLPSLPAACHPVSATHWAMPDYVGLGSLAWKATDIAFRIFSLGHDGFSLIQLFESPVLLKVTPVNSLLPPGPLR